jgi:hypothetical protein
VTPRYPEASVRLVGEDGDALLIIARVGQALRDAGVDRSVRREFEEEAVSGDYDHLLRTVMRWVTVDDEGDEDW